jgi:hypothetical protein
MEPLHGKTVQWFFMEVSMRYGRWIGGLASTVMLAGMGALAASPAGAATAGHHPGVIGSSSHITMADGTVANCGGLNTYNTRNGSNLWLNAPSLSNFAPFEEDTNSARSLKFCNDGGTFNGLTEGPLVLGADGKFMAAADNCNSIVVKPNQSDNGTIWGFDVTSNGIKWVSRYCSQLFGPNWDASSNNIAGHDWTVKTDGMNGYFQGLNAH